MNIYRSYNVQIELIEVKFNLSMISFFINSLNGLNSILLIKVCDNQRTMCPSELPLAKTLSLKGKKFNKYLSLLLLF
jgi:hypothetical protein